jgi:hypothetical protein
MKPNKIIFATLLGGIALFLLDGAFQAIPNFGIRAVERLETSNLTTQEFDNLQHPMAYIVTDKVVSFTASQPAQFYNLGKFFTFEFISALVISFLFALVFSKMIGFNLKERLRMTFIFALIASIAIHISYFNWWGFSAVYTIGVILKTTIGWTALAYIQNRFFFKID